MPRFSRPESPKTTPPAQPAEVGPTPKKKKLIERAGKPRSPIKNALLASLALHGVVAGGPKVKELTGEAVQSVSERVSAMREREALQEARAEAVERAQEQIEQGRLNVWEFLRDTALVEQRAAHEEGHDAAGAERNFNEAAVRLRTELQGLHEVHNASEARRVSEALQRALADYRYFAGMMEMDAVKFYEDRGGPCGSNSLGIDAALSAAGVNQQQLSVRYYPPNQEGISHLAPVLTYGTHAMDLTSGREAEPSSVRLSMPDVVSAYARAHGIRSVGERLGQMLERGSSTQNVGQGGWTMDLPRSARTDRPFHGSAPFYGPLIHTAEQTAARVQEREQARQEDLRSLILELDVESRQGYATFMADPQITGGEVAHGETVSFIASRSLEDYDWQHLSRMIERGESNLDRVTDPVQRVSLLGSLVDLYQIAEFQSMTSLRRQSARLAKTKIEQYQRQGTELLRSSNVVQRIRRVTGPNTMDVTIAKLSLFGLEARQAALDLIRERLRETRYSNRNNLSYALTSLILHPETRIVTWRLLSEQPGITRADYMSNMLTSGGNWISWLRFDGQDEASREMRVMQDLWRGSDSRYTYASEIEGLRNSSTRESVTDDGWLFGIRLEMLHHAINTSVRSLIPEMGGGIPLTVDERVFFERQATELEQTPYEEARVVAREIRDLLRRSDELWAQIAQPSQPEEPWVNPEGHVSL